MKKNGVTIQWNTLDGVIKLIKEMNPKTNQQKFWQARDIAALNEYKKRKEA